MAVTMLATTETAMRTFTSGLPVIAGIVWRVGILSHRVCEDKECFIDKLHISQSGVDKDGGAALVVASSLQFSETDLSERVEKQE